MNPRFSRIIPKKIPDFPRTLGEIPDFPKKDWENPRIPDKLFLGQFRVEVEVNLIGALPSVSIEVLLA
jgi:hypothetical protein